MTIDGPDLCHALAARRSARGLSRLYDRHLASSGLSISQFSILSLIEAHQPIRIAELARFLVMERTTLVRALKPLQLDEMVSGEIADRRGTLLLSLTAKGEAKFSEALPLWRSAQHAFEEDVGQDRAAGMRSTILDLGFHQ